MKRTKYVTYRLEKSIKVVEGKPVEKELSAKEKQKLAEKSMRAATRLAEQALAQKPGSQDPDAPWTSKMLCSELETIEKNFFTSDNKQEQQLAKIACERCVVTESCLNKALEDKEPYFVLGGMTADERKALIRRARIAAVSDRQKYRADRKAIKASRGR